MSIVVEHVTKRYEGAPVVQDVSLEVAAGELFVLLGPSGSGKSTLLRMIGGLVGVDAGRVRLRGRDVTDLSARERGVGFVFQHYALFRHMSVADNVEFALAVRGAPAAERRRRRDELLDLVDLRGFGGRRPGQLSGGQQQRVALARALAHEPAVLLLDEPFGALDAKIRVDLRRTIREIQRAVGITAIFVTHDQEEAFEVGDRIAVLHQGRLLEAGRPDDLYLRPQTRFVATFLGAGNLLVGQTAPDGVRLGPVALPLATRAEPEPAPRRVQVLFRPEDVELAPSVEALTSPALGRGTVEHVTFSGALERLRLRIPRLPGARPVAPALAYGADHLLVDVSRSSYEALRLPLRAGDTAAVGVRRVHPLARRRLAVLLLDDGSPEGGAARAVGEALVERADARLLAHGGPDAHPPAPSPATEFVRTGADPERAAEQAADRGRFDLALLGLPPRSAVDLAEGVLAAGDHHLLLVPRDGRLPGRMLVCAAGGEPGKRVVQFAGRFAQDLGAAATVLTVVADREDGPSPARAFLEASVRVLEGWGVDARPLVRSGDAHDEVLAELNAGGYDALVVGAPFPVRDRAPTLAGLAGRLLQEARSHTVLVVRSTAETDA